MLQPEGKTTPKKQKERSYENTVTFNAFDKS
jgi:hypothetical protein